MTYKIIFDQKEYTDMFGHHKAWHKEFDIPYKQGETVWYCYKKNKKYAQNMMHNPSVICNFAFHLEML